MNHQTAVNDIQEFSEKFAANPEDVRKNLAAYLRRYHGAMRTLGMEQTTTQLRQEAEAGADDTRLQEVFFTSIQKVVASNKAEAAEAQKAFDTKLTEMSRKAQAGETFTPGEVAILNTVRDTYSDLADLAETGMNMSQNVADIQQHDADTVAAYRGTIRSVVQDWGQRAANTFDRVKHLVRTQNHTRRNVPASELQGVLDFNPETHEVCERDGAYYVIDRTKGEIDNDRDAAILHSDGTRLDANREVISAPAASETPDNDAPDPGPGMR